MQEKYRILKSKMISKLLADAKQAERDKEAVDAAWIPSEPPSRHQHHLLGVGPARGACTQFMQGSVLIGALPVPVSVPTHDLSVRSPADSFRSVVC